MFRAQISWDEITLTFTNGLKPQTWMLLDASTGGTMKNETLG